MAISNLQETLLMYTRYKSRMNKQLAAIQMNTLSATKKVTDTQLKYNRQIQALDEKFEPDEMREDYTEYIAIKAQLENEMEFEMKNIQSWQDQLDMDKLSLEARLAEISANEKAVQTMLKTNLKTDFTYGGASQG